MVIPFVDRELGPENWYYCTNINRVDDIDSRINRQCGSWNGKSSFLCRRLAWERGNKFSEGVGAAFFRGGEEYRGKVQISCGKMSERAVHATRL